MVGVVNVEPLPNELPPVSAAYQLIVPAEVVAPSDTDPGPQRLPGKVPVIVGAPMLIAVPLSLPVTDGLPDTTLTRYPVPSAWLTGIVALIRPEFWEINDPILVGLVNEPSAFDN